MKTTCPICLEPVKHNIKYKNTKHFFTRTTCGHTFHNKCIRKWYGSKWQSATCPMCRTSVNKNIRDELRQRATTMYAHLQDLHRITVKVFYELVTTNTKAATSFADRFSLNQADYKNFANFYTHQNLSKPFYDTVWNLTTKYLLDIHSKRNDTKSISEYYATLFEFTKSLQLLLNMLSQIYDITPFETITRIVNRRLKLIVGYNVLNKYVRHLLNFAIYIDVVADVRKIGKIVHS